MSSEKNKVVKWYGGGNPGQGDILYYQNGDWVKLPIGEIGQYLIAQGGTTPPIWDYLGSAPEAPLNLAAVGSTTAIEIALTWDTAIGADTYSVYRATDTGGPYTSIQTGVATNNYTDYPPAAGTYYYVVTAVNPIGESLYSNEASDLTAIEIPIGSIVAWSGTSPPANWAFCDGSSGTPDLRNKFIVGAGNTYNPGNSGGTNTVNLSTHTHPFVGNHTHPNFTVSIGNNITPANITTDITGSPQPTYHQVTHNHPNSTTQLQANTSPISGTNAPSYDNRKQWFMLAWIMKIS